MIRDINAGAFNVLAFLEAFHQVEDCFGIGNLLHNGIAVFVFIEDVIQRDIIDYHITGGADSIQLIGQIGTRLIKTLLKAEGTLRTYCGGGKGIDGCSQDPHQHKDKKEVGEHYFSMQADVIKKCEQSTEKPEVFQTIIYPNIVLVVSLIRELY